MAPGYLSKPRWEQYRMTRGEGTQEKRDQEALNKSYNCKTWREKKRKSAFVRRLAARPTCGLNSRHDSKRLCFRGSWRPRRELGAHKYDSGTGVGGLTCDPWVGGENQSPWKHSFHLESDHAPTALFIFLRRGRGSGSPLFF